MQYEFSFYKDEDFDGIEELVIRSYEWEYPYLRKRNLLIKIMQQKFKI